MIPKLLNNREFIRIAMSVGIIGLMVMTAEITQCKEIIFPEISAICLGALISPKFAWNTSKARMVICITICALCGYLISLSIPTEYIKIRLLLAFVVGNMVLLFSKTGFVPMLSAIILPVMMNTDTFIYPLSAFLLTLAVITILSLLEREGIKEKYGYRPELVNTKREKDTFLQRLFVYAVLLIIFTAADCQLALAPPLIVAFTELCHPNNKARKQPVKVCFLMCISAFIGDITKLIVCTLYGIPLFVGVMFAVSMVIVILRYCDIYMPPILAMTTLAFLFEFETLYTFKITVGFSVLMWCARFFFTEDNIFFKTRTK